MDFEDEINLELPLPDWIKYLAQDDDGSWWGYEDMPVHGTHCRWTNLMSKTSVSHYVRLCQTSQMKDSKNQIITLRRTP